MLIRFRIANYKSIKDEQELSMVASSLAGPTDALIHVDGLGVELLRVAAIYGANASGKSNLLDALRFMREVITDSHRLWKPDGAIPRTPFLLSRDMLEEPSMFEIEFLLDGVRFRYGFVLDTQRIREEWLYAHPKGKKQLWFWRDVESPGVFKFGKTLTGENRAIRSLTRENSLFLSAAAQNNHAALSPVYGWIADRLAVVTNADRVQRLLDVKERLADEQGKAAILDLLAFADLGISGVEVGEGERGPLWDVIGVMLGSTPSGVSFRHTTKQGEDGALIPLADESQGTQALFALAGQVIDALSAGGVLCVDELDASLHTALSGEIVRIFDSSETNPNNAQLVFNTHDTNLLGEIITNSGEIRLRRDQIWLTEKDDAGATHLYPLTDFKPRAQENLERGYLQGRYGAVPVVGSLGFLDGLRGGDGEGAE